MTKTKSRHKSATVLPTPESGRAGAPPGNRNAIGSGLHSFKRGRWPAGTSYIPRIVRTIAAGLRSELVRIHGATTIYSEALISTVQTHEARALLNERMLRRNKQKLSIAEQADLLERIGRARDSRDRVLEKMGLRIRRDEDDVDPWGIPGGVPGLPAPETFDGIPEPDAWGTPDDAVETPEPEPDGIPEPEPGDAPGGRPRRHERRGRGGRFEPVKPAEPEPDETPEPEPDHVAEREARHERRRKRHERHERHERKRHKSSGGRE